MNTDVSPATTPLTHDGESEPTTGQENPLTMVSSMLTTLTYGTAPLLSAFLVVHLSAPIAANFGGSSLASSVMLLGREYYQTTFGERFLLLAPFAIHTSSAIFKRMLITIHRNKESVKRFLPAASKPDSDVVALDMESQETVRPTPRSRPPSVPHIRRMTSLLSLSAYGALFVFVPVHVATHRWTPWAASSSRIPPSGTEIDPVSSSELDFEFVKTSLHKWPLRSWMLYTGLVGCVLVHAFEGSSLILPGLRRRSQSLNITSNGNVVSSAKQVGWSGFTGKRTVQEACVMALPVLTGLLVLSREPLSALASMVGRYEHTFMSSWVYRA